MNRKQRREMTRKIQSQDLSLEVVHPDAAGIDIGNEVHYVAVPPNRTAKPYVASDAPPGTEGDGGLAQAMRDPDHGPAIDRGVLDRGLRYLESSGFEVYLVNARRPRIYPGAKATCRKSMADEAAHLWTVAESLTGRNSHGCGPIGGSAMTWYGQQGGISSACRRPLRK